MIKYFTTIAFLATALKDYLLNLNSVCSIWPSASASWGSWRFLVEGGATVRRLYVLRARVCLLHPFVDRRAALLARRLYALTPVESFVQGQAEQANVDVVAKPVVGHAPYLIAHDDTAVVVNEVVALEAKGQVEVADKGDKAEPLEEALIQLSVFEEKLRANGENWVEVVIIAITILDSERVPPGVDPQITALWLPHIEQLAKHKSECVGQTQRQDEAPGAAVVNPLQEEDN